MTSSNLFHDAPPVPPRRTEQEQKLEQFRSEVEAAIENRQLDLALKKTDQAVTRFAREGNTRGQATALFLQGIIYRHQDDSPACIHYLAASQEIWLALGDKAKAAECLNECGGTAVQQAHYADAMTYFHRSLSLYEQVGDLQRVMAVRSNIATIYLELGDIATALEGLQQCLPYFEEHGSVLSLAGTLQNIAEAYNQLESPAEAIPFAQRSLSLYTAADNPKGIAEIRSVLGTSYRAMGQMENALSHFQQALHFAEKTGIHWTIALILSDLGDLFVRLRRFEEAREVLERSLLLNSEHGNRFIYGMELQRFGALFTNPGFSGHNDARALELLREAQQVAEECDSPMLLVPVYESLAALYERRGAMREALHCHHLLRSIEKRLFNEASDKRIKSIKMRAEVEEAQKDAEIARRGTEIARRGAEILQLRNVELASALQEADRLRLLADERAAHSQRIAETLQEAVLPTLPDSIVAGLSVRTFYQPTSDEAAIGGDFYDVFPLEEGKAALVVGDVIGHGLEAAISISKVRFALRAFLSQNPDGDIGETLGQLNDFLVKANVQKRLSQSTTPAKSDGSSPDRERLVALTLMTIVPSTGELCIAAAGMEPALLIRAGKRSIESVEYLDAGEMILGAIPNIRYTAKQVRIVQGDLLAVTTDGITEAFSEDRNEQFGLRGLARNLRSQSSPSVPLAILGETALDAVQNFIEGPCRDDICLLLARLDDTTAR